MRGMGGEKFGRVGQTVGVPTFVTFEGTQANRTVIIGSEGGMILVPNSVFKDALE